MRFYNVEMKGKFLLDKKASLPSYLSGDEGKLIYYANDVYISDSASNVKIWSENNISELATQLSFENVDATTLDGELPSYYTDGTNATGILGVLNGGTGADNAGDARTNLVVPGLCTNNNFCGSNKFYGLTEVDGTFRVDGISNRMYGTSSSYTLRVDNYSAGPAVTACSAGLALCVRGMCGIYICGADKTCHGFQMNSYNACNLYPSIYVVANGNCGMFQSSPGACIFSVCNYGIYGATNASTYAVGGNTAYQVTSSKHIKLTRPVCLTNCLKANPLTVYRYYWDDSNNQGYNETIGPTAEDFNKTFNVNHAINGDEYEGLWTVDGAALGLAIETIKDMDTVKATILQMYSCIQKLETLVEQLNN